MYSVSPLCSHSFAWNYLSLGRIPLHCFYRSSDITIRLPSEEYATIAKRALEVDPELNPEKIDKSFETEGRSFIA